MRRTPRPRTPLVLAVVLATGALLITACSSAGGNTATDAAGAPTTPKPKVTVTGDSISIGLGASLRSRPGAAGLDVKVIGEEGTGLARPDRFDWPARLTKLAAEFPPRVLLLSLGSNDAQDLTDANGKVVVPFTNQAAWDAAYKERLAAAFDAFRDSPAGTKVVWVGHVVTAEPKVGQTNRHVHRLATEVAADRPWVQVEDLTALLGTGEQPATDCLVPDGLHLTTACLDRAAEALLPKLPTS